MVSFSNFVVNNFADNEIADKRRLVPEGMPVLWIGTSRYPRWPRHRRRARPGFLASKPRKGRYQRLLTGIKAAGRHGTRIAAPSVAC